MKLGSAGFVTCKVIALSGRQWYFFTRSAAEAYRDGELKGKGTVQDIIPLDARTLARSMEQVTL